MRAISQRELRNDSGEVMRALDAGESFIVMRNGVPVGELTPLRRNAYVARAEAYAVLSRAASGDYRRFRRDLDAASDQNPMPRG